MKRIKDYSADLCTNMVDHLRHRFITDTLTLQSVCIYKIPERPSWLCRQPVVSDTPSLLSPSSSCTPATLFTLSELLPHKC